MRQLCTSYKRTWRRVAAPEQVLRNGGWDRADEDLGWLTNDDVRSLTSTNKQAPAKGQRVIDVTVYKRMRCSIITRARTPRRFSKVTFSLILAKSSKITIFGTHVQGAASLIHRFEFSHVDSLWWRIWALCGINQQQAALIFFFFFL